MTRSHNIRSVEYQTSLEEKSATSYSYKGFNVYMCVCVYTEAFYMLYKHKMSNSMNRTGDHIRSKLTYLNC